MVAHHGSRAPCSAEHLHHACAYVECLPYAQLKHPSPGAETAAEVAGVDDTSHGEDPGEDLAHSQLTRDPESGFYPPSLLQNMK